MADRSAAHDGANASVAENPSRLNLFSHVSSDQTSNCACTSGSGEETAKARWREGRRQERNIELDSFASAFALFAPSRSLPGSIRLSACLRRASAFPAGDMVRGAERFIRRI